MKFSPKKTKEKIYLNNMPNEIIKCKIMKQKHFQ